MYRIVALINAVGKSNGNIHTGYTSLIFQVYTCAGTYAYLRSSFYWCQVLETFKLSGNFLLSILRHSLEILFVVFA